MKGLVRSKSGRQIYGQNWQNIDDESSKITQTEIEVELELPISGNRRGSLSDHQSAMHKAALEGDWLAAEMLLDRDPTLARDEITESGDRALHIAAAMKHEEFVQKLVERMSPSDLALHDGRGYTACCYVAVTGIVEIADVMMKKNPNLGTSRDKNGTMPLHKAALHGNEEMVSYFLKSAKVEDLSKEEWFDLLLVAIRSNIYYVALEILEKDGSLATMRNDEGTALHLLARLDISLYFFTSKEGRRLKLCHPLIYSPVSKIKVDEMHPYLRLLAEKLWGGIQRLEEASVVELMKNPPILHDAAKVGNAELITMLTRTYPNLIWDTDSNGYTIFHIAVIYRRENIFGLIHQIGAMKYFVAISQDENNNNILHLAAKLAPQNARKIVSESALQMKSEIRWFKEVEAIVPPPCLEMRNKDGHTPRELFSIQHKDLLEKSETWMRNTTDSCMLVTTLMLTVVFAAVFTPPGGNNSETGIPIHLKSKWFTCLVIFEALALFGSAISIIVLWSIMTSSFEQDEFFKILPNQLVIGLMGMMLSLVHTISAFMSAYFLMFVEERVLLVLCIVLVVYIMLIYAFFNQFNRLWLNLVVPAYLSGTLSRPSRHSLFKQHDMTIRNKSRYRALRF